VKILVFGAGGQVGREVSRAARPASFELLALDKAASDISNLSAVSKVIERHKPDLVINLAAHTAVDRAESEAEMAWAVNCAGAANITKVCGETATPLIHLSTDYVFDGCKPAPYLEDDAVNPLNVYGRSKEAGERAVRTVTHHVILRTAWVYGAYGTNFVKTMLRLAAERPVLRVVADQYGCPTAAADIAAALITIARQIEQGSADWGTFHFAGTGSTSWHGMAEEIVRLAERFTASPGVSGPRVEPITAEQYKAPAERPMNSRLDCGKITASFGILPTAWRSSLAAVVRELVEEAGR
jgi:dTDP-4-dehydrorhamnose reductase